MSYKVERDFVAHGLRCVVILGSLGFRCGYVEVLPGHPLFGVDYNADGPHSPEMLVSCHGGLTYSSGDAGQPYPVESSGWWFGFDCGHAGDAVEPWYPEAAYRPGTLWTEEMVAVECAQLAKQLADIKELK